MHIRRLCLRDFGKFAKLDVEFGRGLNIVRGPNEAGKTTLQRAISSALLDRPTGKNAEQDYRAWGAERMYRLELDCQLSDGRDVRLIKDYESKTHELSSSQGVDSSRKALDEFAEKALGTRSLKVFESTACIDQDAMPNLDAGRAEIAQQMQAILVGGGDVSLDQAISRLERKIGDLEKGWRTHAPVSPGPMGTLRQRIEAADEKLARVQSEVSRLEAARERLSDLRARLSELQRELVPKTNALQVHETRIALQASLAELTRAEEELEGRLAKLGESDRQKQDALDAIADLAALQHLEDHDRKSLRQIHQNLILAEAKAQGRAEDVARLEQRQAQVKPTHPRRRTEAVMLTVLGFALGLAGLFSLAMGSQPWIRALGIAGAVFGVLLFLGGLGWLARTALRKSEDLQSELQQARHLQEDAAAEAARVRDELGKKVQALGYEKWEQVEEGFQRLDALNRQLSEVAARREGLLRTRETIEDVEAQRKQASRQRRDAQEKLVEFAAIPALNLVAYEALSKEVAELQREQQSNEREQLGLQGTLEGGTFGLEDLLRLQEEKAALEEEFKRLEFWHGSYELALQVMREARSGAMRTVRDEMAPRMGRYLQRLTAGRYSQVQVDESLEPVLVHPSKQAGPIEMGEMSQGTRDQLYLSARLALCDVLFGDRRPPIIMDDPFVKFDPERRAAALALCKELGRDRQFILFTCHDGYDEYADSVIDLGARQ